MKQTAHTALSAIDAVFVRRSVRSFERHPIDDETIRALLDAAVQAPTAMHLDWKK